MINTLKRRVLAGATTAKDDIPLPFDDGQQARRDQLTRLLMTAKVEDLTDLEVLELVLLNIRSKANKHHLSQRLLSEFGGFNGVVSASGAQLLGVAGVGPATVTQLKLIVATARRLSRSRVLTQPVLSSWDALVDYCHTLTAHSKIEHFRLLYLDTQNRLIADEEQNTGTVNHVPIYPREVVKRALEVNASAVILVHNHPSGDPTPSDADITMTQNIIDALGTVHITVHDHLIIGKSREISFRTEGYL